MYSENKKVEMIVDDNGVDVSKKSKTKILVLGTTGFPFGSATIQRQIQLSKSLINAGFDVFVINNRSSNSKLISKRENIKTIGTYEGIKYFYSSLLPYRSSNFILRNITKLFGAINEVITIAYLRLFKKANYILLRGHKLKAIKYYSNISRILKMDLIYDYVEFYDSLGKRELATVKAEKDSFDYNFIKYVDKVIVISKFLELHVQSLEIKKEMIKIPPIIDFNYVDNISTENSSHNFLLFCGSAAYFDVIEFIVSAYLKSEARNQNYILKLVINGSEDQLNRLNQLIVKSNCEKNIEVLTKLPYVDLIKMYKMARALLIPINKNLQDDARFPFKICEYVASKRPIITSNSGAILEFFTNNENALIAEAGSEENFAEKINFVISNPNMADELGNNGYILGKKVFNYATYSLELKKNILS